MATRNLSECYFDHFHAAYNLLKPQEKKIIDNVHKNLNVSVANKLFAQNFIKDVIVKAEKFFDLQNEPKSAQINEIKDDQIADI